MDLKSKYYQFKNAKPKVKLKVKELLLKSMYVIKEMIFSNDASLKVIYAKLKLV